MSRLFFLGLFVFCVGVVRADEPPSRMYRQVHNVISEADLLTREGRVDEGLEKYTEAWHRLRKLKADFPDWEPTVVHYRIKYVTQKLGTRVPTKAEPIPDNPNLQPQTPVKAIGLANPTGSLALFPQQKPISSIRILEIDYISRREDIPIHENKIRQNMMSTKGGNYSANVVDQDIRNLYATGDYANLQISANEMRSEDGERGVRLTVLVDPKPVLTEIELKKISPDGIEDGKLSLNSKDLPLHEAQIGRVVGGEILRRQANRWEKIYREKGFPEVQIKPRLDYLEGGKAKVTFQIREGYRGFLRRLKITGNHKISAGEIESVIQLRPKKFWRIISTDRAYNPETAWLDRQRAVEFYRNQGFLDVQVSLHLEKGPEDLGLHYTIREGNRYGVEKIEVEGMTFFPREELLRALRESSRNMEVFDPLELKMVKADGLLRGRPYSPLGLSASAEALSRFYGSRGFRDASVGTKIHEVGPKEALAVHFRVEEGQRSYVDQIEITGNQKNSDAKIRAEIMLSPGEIFDTTKEIASKERILRTGLFRDVQTFAVETERPHHLKLIFRVTEKPDELSFGLSGGYYWQEIPEHGLILGAPFPCVVYFHFSQNWELVWPKTREYIQKWKSNKVREVSEGG